MSFYDAMKDAVGLAQKADNIELYRQLLDLSAQALDMQYEIAMLKQENQRLRDDKEISQKIIRHKSPYITLADEPTDRCYCATCWGNSKKLIQMVVGNDVLCHFSCKVCGNAFFADLEK